MTKTRLKNRLASLLAEAEITINGDNAWDPRIHDDRFYHRVFLHGSLGLGEAWMDKWWDCSALDQFLTRVLQHRLDRRLTTLDAFFLHLQARLVNLQQPRRAFAVGKQHYDIGNEWYAAMLDSTMTYSCGYWANAENLEQAQIAKIDLICRKLQLEPGMLVLDIGCGWGGAAAHAARNYGVEVVGLTISSEQAEAARQRCAGLPVEIRLQDYREVREAFDRAYSIGMFEHVGYKNYGAFMELLHRCLPGDGLAVLHTIGGNRSSTGPDPWLGKYIFPNSMLPSAQQITRAIEGRLIVEDWQNFGPDYDQTLQEWYANFTTAWPRFAARYGDRFFRMWSFYLLSCQAVFRARRAQLWQLVLSPGGRTSSYRSPR